MSFVKTRGERQRERACLKVGAVELAAECGLTNEHVVGALCELFVLQAESHDDVLFSEMRGRLRQRSAYGPSMEALLRELAKAQLVLVMANAVRCLPSVLDALYASLHVADPDDPRVARFKERHRANTQDEFAKRATALRTVRAAA